MRMQAYLLLFLVWTTLVQSSEYLISKEFVYSFTPTDITGWAPITNTMCTTTQYLDFSGNNIMGLFTQSNAEQKTYTGLPPHWSLSLRMDIILFGTFNSTEYVYIYVDGVQNGKYTKTSSNQLPICNYYSYKSQEHLVLHRANVTTHTASQAIIKFMSSTTGTTSKEGAGFKNFFLYVDTCDISCLTCNGPTANQCLTCPSSSTKTGNSCACNTGYIQHLYSCVGSCPTGYVLSNSINQCIVNPCLTNCGTCDTTNQVCTACSTGYYLYNGSCLSACPSYAPNSSGICVDFSTALINGQYLLRGLSSSYFGESEISGLNLVATGFLGDRSKSNGALTTHCSSNYHLMGGAFLSGTGAYISRTFTGLAPHWSVRIQFLALIIDSWDTENVVVSIDSATQQKSFLFDDFKTNFCGSMYADSYTIMDFNTTHTASSMAVKISNTLDQAPDDESLGIRDIFILVDFCADHCTSCNASGCLTCAAGYLTYQKKCYQTCPTKTYATSTSCIDCDTSCATCSAAGASSCTSCASPYFLNPNNQCLTTCPSSYWADTSTNTCQHCDTSCLTCASPGTSVSCTSCASPYYLDSATKTCSTTCPAGYFPSTTGQICQSCNTSCKTCTSPGNASSCTSCASPTFLAANPGSCVSTCPSAYYPQSSDQTCQPCDSTCASCASPGTATSCTSCSSTSYMLNTSCVTACPSTYWPRASDRTCQICDLSCYECIAPGTQTSCTSCSVTFLLTVSKTCVATCPTSYWPNTLTQVCQQCDSTCKTCANPGDATHCLSCYNSRLLTSGVCVPRCPDNYWYDSSGTCQLCDGTCLTCDEAGPNRCTSCNNLTYLSVSTCVSNCASSEWPSNTDNTCQPCDSTCLTCENPGTSTSCLSCSPSKFLLNGECLGACPVHYWADAANNICQSCDPTCYTCSDPGAGSAQTACLSCVSPYYFDTALRTCTQTCPALFWGNTSTRICVACDSSCLTCSGGSSVECLSCNSLLYLDTALSSCVSTCPTSYWPRGSDRKCAPCDGSCYSCVDPGSTCTACSSTYLYNSTCLSTCPATYYAQISDHTCQPCDTSCNTCTGPGAASCSSCRSPNYLDSFSSSCVPVCPTAYWGQSSDWKCYPCDGTCLTCSGTSTTCTSCSSSNFLNTLTGTCNSTCPASYWADPSTRTCLPCNNSCMTCIFPGNSNSCLSCPSPNYLESANNSCVSACPTGMWGRNYDLTCQTCTSPCATCIDPGTATSCTSCSGSLYFDPTTTSCVNTCPSSFWPKITDLTCQSCDSTCATCSNPGTQFDCLTCVSPYFFDASSRQCLTVCPDYFGGQVSDNTCHPCSSNCLTCTDPATSTFCLSCFSPYYLDSATGTCLTSCPANYWQNDTDRTCQPCDSSCLTCASPGTASSCLTCPGTQCLSSGSCFTTCQSDPDTDESYSQLIFQIFLVKTLAWMLSLTVGYAKDKASFFLQSSGKIVPSIENNSFFSDLHNLSVDQYIEQKPENGPVNDEVQGLKKDVSLRQLSPIKRAIIKQGAPPITLADFIYSSNSNTQRKKPDDENKQNQDENKDKVYLANEKLKYTILGNEWVSLIYFDDIKRTRVNRTTLIYAKYLSFFVITQMLHEEPLYVITACVVTGQAEDILNSLLLNLFKLIPRYGNTIYSILMVTGMGCLIIIYMAPQIEHLTWHKDLNWSILYLVTFFIDFFIIQQVISFTQYMATISYLNSKKSKCTVSYLFHSPLMIVKIA